MSVPAVLLSLVDQGVIDAVLRPLKSGKEAEVYMVRAQGKTWVAKVYKSIHRSFKQRSVYTEGRKVRNTRDQRAIDRRTRRGKAEEEEAWKSAEVDVLYRLHAQGVRVPTPFNFIDGVLIMELILGADGLPAPRLGEMALDEATARSYYERLLREVVKMLAVGIVHGDLSEYNILVDEEGPAIIDFPQAVDAAANRNAKGLFLRDVANLGGFLQRVIPGAKLRPYGQEIWAAFEDGSLSADMPLSGTFKRSNETVDLSAVLESIDDAEYDERKKQGEGRERATPRRRQVVLTPEPKKSTGGRDGERGRGRRRGGDEGARSASRSGGGGAPRRGSEGRGSEGRGSEGRGSEGADKRRTEPVDSSERGDRGPRQRRRRRRGPGEGADRPPVDERSEARRSDGRSEARRSDGRSEARRSEGRSETGASGRGHAEGHSDSPRSEGGPSGEATTKRRRRRRRRPGSGSSESGASETRASETRASETRTSETRRDRQPERSERQAQQRPPARQGGAPADGEPSQGRRRRRRRRPPE